MEEEIKCLEHFQFGAESARGGIAIPYWDVRRKWEGRET